MPRSFHSLFHAIATASTEEALRFRLMDEVSDYFKVQRWGIYLFNEENSLASCDVRGVSDAFVERYEKLGKSVDLVLQYVLKYHAPAHEALVFPTGGWKQSELYQRCCSECDHEHIMTGPIVGCGKLIGTVHLARVSGTSAFSFHDLASLGAVCSHLSASLARLRERSSVTSNPLLKRLTARELQIDA
ncbi:MAG: GAF domain-containing protein [Cyanobacteriota bacterium]|nr:GAF domain-containing protein [Cyanobacteriota bacterium]